MDKEHRRPGSTVVTLIIFGAMLSFEAMPAVPATIDELDTPAPRPAVKLSDHDLIEAAKLGLVEKLYERSAAHYREQLSGRNLSEEEIEDRLFRAMDAHASCTARAALAQAREQGLAAEIVLKGFATRTRGKEESLILLQLDLEALKLRTVSCNKVLYDNLGLSFY